MGRTRNLVKIFKALSSEPRLQIISLLKDRVLCVGALARHLSITQAAVSQHLHILKDADLVIPEKRGFFVHYRLNKETIMECWDVLASFLEDNNS